MINKIKWIFKQLFPLYYHSIYWAEDITGKNQYVCIWKMWFGKCYKRREFQIVKEL